jgi:hypothetical protein
MNLDGGEQEFLKTQHMEVQEAGAAESRGSLSTHGVSSLNRGLWAIHATAAGVGGYSILAVLVYVADESPAAHARVGRRRSQERRNNWVIGGCLLVYFTHGRRRHRTRRGDG